MTERSTETEIETRKWDRPEWLSEIAVPDGAFDYHRGHPEVGVDQYILEKNLELGSRAAKLKKVYLDQKFWIYCRDAELGREQKKEHVQLYRLLKEGVRNGILVCPASHLLVEETLKQEDEGSRNATTQVIEDLCAGIGIQPFLYLDWLETMDFLKGVHRKYEKLPPERRVWTFVGNLFAPPIPVSEVLDPAANLMLQKVYSDMLAGTKLTTLVKSLEGIPRENLDSTPEFYDGQNRESERHRGDFKTFDEVFMIEIAGGLDALNPTIRRCVWDSIHEATGDDPCGVPIEQVDKSIHEIVKSIYDSFSLKEIVLQMAGLRIMAGIHAALRYKRQKHRKGDKHDHLHARVALPYCDLFLTEKSLAHLLKTKPLQYDVLYGCRIENTDEGAIEAIEQLVN